MPLNAIDFHLRLHSLLLGFSVIADTSPHGQLFTSVLLKSIHFVVRRVIKAHLIDIVAQVDDLDFLLAVVAHDHFLLFSDRLHLPLVADLLVEHALDRHLLWTCLGR